MQLVSPSVALPAELVYLFSRTSFTLDKMVWAPPPHQIAMPILNFIKSLDLNLDPCLAYVEILYFYESFPQYFMFHASCNALFKPFLNKVLIMMQNSIKCVKTAQLVKTTKPKSVEKCLPPYCGSHCMYRLLSRSRP